MTEARVPQIATIAIVSESPPPAGGAVISQIAIINIDREFVIPTIYIPLNAGAFMATPPFYIGQ